MNEIQYTVTGHPVSLRGPAHESQTAKAFRSLCTWKKESSSAPDAWLRADVADAFKYFIGANVGKRPGADTIVITAEMWVEIVGEGMNEEQDRERVRVAFRQLFRTVKWWPQPADLLNILPRRPSAPLRDRRDCSPSGVEGQSDEDHAAQAAKLQEIMDSLK